MPTPRDFFDWLFRLRGREFTITAGFLGAVLFSLVVWGILFAEWVASWF